MKVRFTHDYDHRWPSGAITAFKKGMELTVKAEAGEAALAAKKATSLEKADKPAADAKDAETANAGGSGGLAGADVHPSSGAPVRSERLPDADQR